MYKANMEEGGKVLNQNLPEQKPTRPHYNQTKPT